MAEAKDSKKDSKADAKAAGGNSKKIIIFGTIIVLVAALAGAGTWFAVSRTSGGPAKVEEPKHEEVKETAPPIFHALEPIVVNLSGGSESVMRVAISVQLSSDKDKEKLTAYMPKIQGDLMLLFSSKTDSELLTQEGKIALLDETRKTINKAVYGDQTVKPEDQMVKAVSFTEMIIQ